MEIKDKEKLVLDIESKLKGKVHSTWLNRLTGLFIRDDVQQILKTLGEKKKAGCEICPESSDMLNVFKYTGWDDINVIILGQDPYHTPGIADGLAFSSKKITFRPPSLRNIYKEIETDLYNGLNFNIPDHQNNNLKYLAFQGVFLLNTALTTEIGKPGEHAELWEPFTKMLISYISEYKKDVIFVLWGNHAKKYKKFIDENKHHIIEGVHPSPLSAERGFFGCKHFSQINKHLKTLNKKEIVWENVEYSSMVH